MKRLFIMLIVLLSANVCYADEMQKLQYYLFRSMFDYKNVYEVESLHNFMVYQEDPKIQTYMGGLTISFDHALIKHPEFLYGNGFEWFVRYDAPFCDKFMLYLGKIKECKHIIYTIDKPVDKPSAYFSVERIVLENVDGIVRVKERETLLKEIARELR